MTDPRLTVPTGYALPGQFTGPGVYALPGQFTGPGVYAPPAPAGNKNWAVGLAVVLLVAAYYFLVYQPAHPPVPPIATPGGNVPVGPILPSPGTVPVGTGGTGVIPVGTGGTTVPAGTGGGNVPVGTGGVGDHPADNVPINTGPVATPGAVQAPVVLYEGKAYQGDSRGILPGQRVKIAYIGHCKNDVPNNGCGRDIPPGWFYNSMKINPGTKLLFQRQAGNGDGNLGGWTYSITLQGDNQIYNTKDLDGYLQENGGYSEDVGNANNTLAMSRDYWPSPLYMTVV
jgi:hypothetical protein